MINPGVFHPGFFFSTKFLLHFLSNENLKGVSILELGAGSGLISIYCAKEKQAIVTSSDVSSLSIKNLLENSNLNRVSIRIVQSDLFENLNPDDFEMIIINPPFYPGNPKTESEAAWYCGENFEYFRKLFFQLRERAKPDVILYMVVSEDCEINTIEGIANQNDFQMTLVLERKFWGERNFIYKITKKEEI